MRINRIACLSILAALAVWAQNQNAGPKIQSVTCPSLPTPGAMTCTVTLTKQAPSGGLTVVESSSPSSLTLTYPVTSVVRFTDRNKITTTTSTTSMVTKSIMVMTSGPVTVPQGKTSTSFQVRAQ